MYCMHAWLNGKAGSGRWDEKKEGGAGWKDRMDDWKMQQGNLGPDADDINDEMALYVCVYIEYWWQLIN